MVSVQVHGPTMSLLMGSGTDYLTTGHLPKSQRGNCIFMSSEMALRSVLLIRIGKQNVKIKYIKVEFEKNKNELFLRPCILVNSNG